MDNFRFSCFTSGFRWSHHVTHSTAQQQYSIIWLLFLATSQLSQLLVYSLQRFIQLNRIELGIRHYELHLSLNWKLKISSIQFNSALLIYVLGYSNSIPIHLSFMSFESEFWNYIYIYSYHYHHNQNQNISITVSNQVISYNSEIMNYEVVSVIHSQLKNQIKSKQKPSVDKTRLGKHLFLSSACNENFFHTYVA